VLASVDTSGLGLEIGPSYNPLLPKRSGTRIEIIDHATREELVAKYGAMQVPAEQVGQIEEVDYVSSGGGLVETIGRTAAYDFIICSNVVEHMVDLIGFLRDIEALLKPDGRLSMSVPDQRFCFDLLRPITTSGDVVDGHLNPSRFHTPGSLLESTTYSCAREGHESWALGVAGPLALHVPGLLIPRLIDQWLDQTEYHDAHRWTFTPSSFSLLVQDLRELGYHSLVELESEPPLGHEFFVTLGHRHPPPPRRDRLELLQEIRRELALVATLDGLGPSGVELEVALGAAHSETAARPSSPSELADELASAQRDIDALRTLVAQREEDLVSARSDLNGVLLSRSWQATRPIRRFASLLRRH
jgi:hypothetical protein